MAKRKSMENRSLARTTLWRCRIQWWNMPGREELTPEQITALADEAELTGWRNKSDNERAAAVRFFEVLSQSAAYPPIQQTEAQRLK